MFKISLYICIYTYICMYMHTDVYNRKDKTVKSGNGNGGIGNR